MQLLSNLYNYVHQSRYKGCWKCQFLLLPWVQQRYWLHCCPLAPRHVCALACAHRVPVLLKTHANKAMYQTLWGGRCASARGQPPRKRRRWQSFAFQFFGNEDPAGVWHRDLLQPWQLWCIGLVFMAYGWNGAGSHLCFLLLCFFKAVSLAFLCLPFQFWRSCISSSGTWWDLIGVNHPGNQGW